MNWLSKSKGDSDLYQKKEYYNFKSASLDLINSKDWEIIASDIANDGDIPNRSDTKKLSQLTLNDTIWFKYDLYNNIDINHPMVSLALDIDGNPKNGKQWYGTEVFNYDIIIAVGYVREATRYKGYNFIDKKIGHSKLSYLLETNSFFLGIPKILLDEYKSSRFVASAGNMGLWNDDFQNIITLHLD